MIMRSTVLSDVDMLVHTIRISKHRMGALLRQVFDANFTNPRIADTLPQQVSSQFGLLSWSLVA